MSCCPQLVLISRPRAFLRARRSGFALLITITLLAFLVLLLVSLAALTRVETQVASNNRQLAQARQNALMALNIALGELQEAAGPDQRTTAPAVLGEGATAVMSANAADNGLGATNKGTRYWTGVWGNKSAPEAIFTSAPQPVLLQWLVSGNEKTPSVIAGTDGHITLPTVAASTAFDPTQAVIQADGSALASTTPATAALQINNQPAALLLGPSTAGNNTDAYVVAPLVSIDSAQTPGLAGTTVPVGRIAWWVGDEGVKAKYNLPDPYIANNTPDDDPTPASRDSRYRLLAAQRNGIESMTAFAGANYPLAATSATSALYLGVGNTLTPAGIRLTSPAIDSDKLKQHVHDLTTYSRGVLADSQFGGLRRDLTFHLDARSGDTFLDGRNILPDGATPLSDFPESNYNAKPSLFSETTAKGGLGLTTLDLSPRLGPKWDQLKSFYQLGYDQPGDLEVRPAVDLDVDPVKVQAAITPVILEVRTLFALSAGPSIDTAVVLVLGNPYTRSLKATSGLNFRISLHQNRYTETSHYGEEVGLICNFIGPSSESPRQISSVFTRREGMSKNFPVTTAPSAPPLQMDYLFNGDVKSKSNTVFHHYYPIMKFPEPAGGDGPPDPDIGYPGVLDELVFQIPPGVLNLAPGEAKAYRIAAGGLPSETINGINMKVVPLEEMTDSLPTYCKHPCDPRYVSASSVFSPSDVTGDSFFRVGLSITSDRGAWGSGWDYILSVPGKPGSVLQTFGSIGNTQPDTQKNDILPNHEIPGQVFGGFPTPISGVIHRKLFGKSDAAVYAERNQLGRSQRTSAAYNSGASTNPFTGAAMIPTENAFVHDETAFIDDLDPGNAVQAAWGRGAIGDPVLVSPDGKVVLNDVPAALASDEIPILSMGQLQHADLTADDEALGVNSQPGHAVGNSWYNRLVSRDTSRTDPMENSSSRRNSNWADKSEEALGNSLRYPGFVPDLPKMTQIRRYDMSYLLNAALWDGFFFSTVRPAAADDATSAPMPANRRLTYIGSAPTLGQLRGSAASEILPAPEALEPGENGRAAAAQLLNNGAFNVNSTSVEAWVALLSGLRGLGINDSAAPAGLTPFPHSIRQPGASLAELPADASQRAETYIGFRSLTDEQIRALAKEIVVQVKARGPFLSVAQFVNRNLTEAAELFDPVADTGLAGALQQAMDRAEYSVGDGSSRRINDRLNKSLAIGRDKSTAIYPDDAVMPTGDTSGLGRYMGAPGWLSQADVLQAIGPSLAARSDTFVIRAYGEVLDPVDSSVSNNPVVSGRAWCEAVVQRMTGYVDSSVQPTVMPADAGTLNQAFGRRFRIVSFRWLSANDI